MPNEPSIQRIDLDEALRHFDPLVDLLQELYEDQRLYAPPIFLDQESRRTRCRKLIEHLQSDTALLWGAFIASDLAGFLWAYERDFFCERQMYVNAVVVKESLRGHGIGRLLLDAVATETSRRGLLTIGVSCLAGKHDTLRFYDSHGFIMERCQLVKILDKGRLLHDD